MNEGKQAGVSSIGRVLIIIIALCMVLPTVVVVSFTTRADIINSEIINSKQTTDSEIDSNEQNFTIYGEAKDIVGLKVDVGYVTATNIDTGESVFNYILNGSYHLDLSADTSNGDTILISAQNGVCISNRTLIIETQETRIDFILDPETPSIPPISPPSLDELDFFNETNPWMIPPPTLPMPPEEGNYSQYAEPVGDNIPSEPRYYTQQNETFLPPMPYSLGEETSIVYNITLNAIDTPSGPLKIGKKTPVQFDLINNGKSMIKVYVEISVSQPDNSVISLGDLNYNILPMNIQTKTLTWKPQMGGEQTIIIRFNYIENGISVEYTKEVGIYVLHGTVPWTGGMVFEPSATPYYFPPEDYQEPEPYEIIMIEGNMIIKPGATVIFQENIHGYKPTLIIDGFNRDDETNPFGIVIEKDITTNGVLEIHDGSLIIAQYFLQTRTYKFDVHGILIMDSGSIVKQMYGDDLDYSNPGGIHLFDGSSCDISSGAKVMEGWTHNLFVEGSNTELSILDGEILSAGNGGGHGHGIYVTNDAKPTIQKNNISFNKDSAIYIDTPYDGKISNNTLSSNNIGINCQDASPIIENNTLIGNNFGINLDYDPTITTYDVPIHLGWNFISLPLAQVNTAIVDALDDSDGDGATSWNQVQWYDVTDLDNPWKIYDKNMPGMQTLTKVDHSMGFWINIISLGDGVLTVSGRLETTLIDMYPGWNMVGYPAFDDSSYSVSDLLLETGATEVQGYDSTAEYLIKTLDDTYILQRGEAYWVQIDTPITWTVNPDRSSPIIQNNHISNSYSHGILCYFGSKPIIFNNTIERNAFGINLFGSPIELDIINNTVNRNINAFLLTDADPVLKGNSIQFNEEKGLWLQKHSHPQVENNTISYNGLRTIISDDVEAGSGDWVVSGGQWHIIEDISSPYPNSFSPTHSWWYGDDGTGTYEGSGELYMDTLDLSEAQKATLTFQSWYETETMGTDKDQRWVYVWDTAGTNYIEVQLYGDQMSKWFKHSIDLSALAGLSEVCISFYFDTIDSSNNDHSGWYIDDIQVTITNASVEGFGVICDDASNPSIQYNTISLNNVGVACYANSNPIILRNNITGSQQAGIYVNDSSPLIRLNKISSESTIAYVDPPCSNMGLFGLSSQSQNPLTLDLNSFTFDPIKGEPFMPDELRIDSYPDETKGMYILQFVGPIQKTWIFEIESVGAEVYSYLPNFAYIVRMENDVADMVSLLPSVRWVGFYQPIYRMDSRLFSCDETTVNVTILVINDEGITSSIDNLLPLMNSVQSQWNFRFYKGLHANVDINTLGIISRMQNVFWIEPYVVPTMLGEVAAEIVGGNWSAGNPWNGPGSYVNSLGYDGSGVVVSVVDTGIDDGDALTMHADLYGRVDTFIDYTETDDTDGVGEDRIGHGTHCAGTIAGNGLLGTVDSNGYLYGFGVAPNANIINQRIFDDGGWWASPGVDVISRDAVIHGAVISSNSWGALMLTGYDIFCSEYDYLVRDANPDAPGDQPCSYIFSAGNSGSENGYVFYSNINSPAAAKNVIAVGASLNYRPDDVSGGSYPADDIDAIVDFSSRGPCKDGRIKPDLVAPGTWIASTQSSSAISGGLWGSIDDNYQWSGGTSMSTPAVAGGAALFVQYFREISGGTTPSPALTKAALINGAEDMIDIADPTDGSQSTPAIPNNDEGWGRMNLVNVIKPKTGAYYVDQDYLFTDSGDEKEYSILVGDTTVPFKVTLAWTDAAAYPNANPALVNNLDLMVTDSDGNIYIGNQFNDGWSITGQTNTDSINNIESVYVNPSEVSCGEYIIKITAANIAGDGVTEIPGFDQDFALIVTYGEVTNKGKIYFDRDVYRSSTTAKVTVSDSDLVSTGTISISAQSSPILDFEVVTLIETPVNSGIFIGTIDLVLAPLGVKNPNNGCLEVLEYETIIVQFIDADDGSGSSVVVFDTAVIDDTQPIISNLKATILPGASVEITWDTDEDTDGFVFYDTSIPTRWIEKEYSYSNEHAVVLSKLIHGATYFFAVQSVDTAGNVALDDNGGKYYCFTIFNFIEGTGIWITDWSQPSNTKPVVIENNVTENYRGIVVLGASDPIIDDNLIYHNLMSGIWSEKLDLSLGWPHIKISNNNISYNGWDGIHMYGVVAKIENNMVFHNIRNGIYLDFERDDDSVIMNNTVIGNGYDSQTRTYWDGINCAVAPIIINNTVVVNGRAGIGYNTRGNPETGEDIGTYSIQRNNLQYNSYGLYIVGTTGSGGGSDRSSGFISESVSAAFNNISYNYCGIICSYNSPLLITYNNISNNSFGVNAKSGLAWFENNTICDNYCGVIGSVGNIADPYSNIIGINNSITFNHYGIYNAIRCNGIYYKNEITYNFIGCVNIDGAKNQFIRNNISYNDLANLWFLNNGASTIVNNNISDSDYGLYLFGPSTTTISGNNITNHSVVGIFSDYLAGVYGLFTIQRNNISNNFQGVRLNNSTPYIQNNIIENNTYGLISTGSSPTIKNNTIHTNGMGIYCSKNYDENHNNINQLLSNEYYVTVTNEQQLSQSFIPTFNDLYQINIYLKDNGANPESSITVHLKDSLDSEDIATSLPNKWSDGWYYLSFLPHVNLKPFKEYFMVISTDATIGGYDVFGSPTDDDYYENGEAQIISNDEIIDIDGDIAFEILGDGSFGEIVNNSVKFNQYISYYKAGAYTKGRLEGWGIYLDNSSQVIRENNITANGFGLTVRDGSILAINNTVMAHMYPYPWGTAPHPEIIASVGCGMIADNGSFVFSVNNTFITNARNVQLLNCGGKLDRTIITSSYEPEADYLPVYVGIAMDNATLLVDNSNITANANEAISVNRGAGTKIYNTTITNNKNGISIMSGNLTVDHCNISNNLEGIDCVGSTKVFIVYNNISNNELIGIGVYESELNILYNNITMNTEGIVYWNCIEGTFSGNTIIGPITNDETYGIYLDNTDIDIVGNNISFSDWGIFFIGSDSEIRKNNIEECGVGAYLYDSMPYIINNNFDGNDEGIFCEEYSDPLIIENNITGNTYGIASRSYSTPYVRYNNIMGNVNYGIINLDMTEPEIYAKDNWWGDANGPTHSSSPGAGDWITDGVLWDPPSEIVQEWW